jgi:hypothetical protein
MPAVELFNQLRLSANEWFFMPMSGIRFERTDGNLYITSD